MNQHSGVYPQQKFTKHTALVGSATRLELVGTTTVLAVKKTHELRGDVAVVVRWSIRVGGYVPSWGEDEEVCEGSGGVAGPGREHTEDGGVDVIDGD